MSARRVHHGFNIKRLREIKGMKQEALALAMREPWNQRRISILESKPVIPDDLLEQVAKALGVPPGLIEEFHEEMVFHTLSNSTKAQNGSMEEQLHHMGKLLELMEENKELYERLLQAEKEKNKLLEMMLAERK